MPQFCKQCIGGFIFILTFLVTLSIFYLFFYCLSRRFMSKYYRIIHNPYKVRLHNTYILMRTSIKYGTICWLGTYISRWLGNEICKSVHQDIRWIRCKKRIYGWIGYLYKFQPKVFNLSKKAVKNMKENKLSNIQIFCACIIKLRIFNQ